MTICNVIVPIKRTDNSRIQEQKIHKILISGAN